MCVCVWEGGGEEEWEGEGWRGCGGWRAYWLSVVVDTLGDALGDGVGAGVGDGVVAGVGDVVGTSWSATTKSQAEVPVPGLVGLSVMVTGPETASMMLENAFFTLALSTSPAVTR